MAIIYIFEMVEGSVSLFLHFQIKKSVFTCWASEISSLRSPGLERFGKKLQPHKHGSVFDIWGKINTFSTFTN
jgi:hypothetical protein